MPYLETPQELAEALADLVGVYGGHDDDEPKPCRICWTMDMTDRIRKAVENETQINRMHE